MKSSRKYALSILFAAIAAAGTAEAWAHATLQSSVPAKDTEVSAPKEVTLHFNEKLEAAFSTAKVVDGSGKPVTSGKAVLDQKDPAILRVPVQNLAPGKYTVQFGVVGHDGHRRKGEYSFTVK